MGNFLDKAGVALARMVSPEDKVVAAVSGGPDSISLLHILNEKKSQIGFQLFLAHLDHRTRAGESQKDARFVKDLGEQLGLPTFIESIDVSRESEDLKLSFQEAARIVRYRFLFSVMERVQGTKLALGHHADDQVETILQHLLRGSGLKGLSGMPETRGAIIRPLLACTRTEIEAYLQSRGLQSRQDSSNASDRYLRNRIRRELVPVLKSFNPNFPSKLLETARIIRDDDQCLDDQADRLYAEMAASQNNGPSVLLNRDAFIRQTSAHQKRLIRKAIFQVQGNLLRVSTGHVDQLIELFKKKIGRINLPDGLIAVSRVNGIEFTTDLREKNEEPPSGEQAGESTELVIPGTTHIAGVGLSLDCRLLPPGSPGGLKVHPNRAFLDFDKTGGDIRARFFRPGDRFIPLGMKGRKKLKSFFIDEKIPRQARAAIPVLTTRNDDIIWIYGKRIAEEFRVTENTRKVLSIEGDRDFPSFC